jgi:membrane protein DedA with SNARE-associated domain
MIELYHTVVQTILHFSESFGYFGIFFLMFLESTFFPFPSEIVIIPAGFLIFTGKMNFIPVAVAGVLGSILGALLNYYLAFYFGEALLLKILSKEKLSYVQDFFIEHGAFSTFFGRLVPIIRQYISFPAGLAKMPVKIFILYTTLGSFIWIVFLAALGYYLGNNQELIKQYIHQITLVIFAIIIIIIAKKLYKKYKNK